MAKKRLTINISNKVFYTFSALAIMALLAIGVYAYGTNNPSFFGHSAGEIDGVCKFLNGAWVDCPSGQEDLEAYVNNDNELCYPISGGGERCAGESGGGYISSLWIGQFDGHLQECDTSGSCIDHGDKGSFIYSMAVYNNKLWIGQSEGELQECDTSGSCIDHGDKGDFIYSMAVY